MNHILKLTEGDKIWYLGWSDAFDRPATVGMSRGEFVEWYTQEYMKCEDYDQRTPPLAERLERADKTGTSAMYSHGTLDACLSFNRAGKNDQRLTKEQLIEFYCKRREFPNYT